MLLKMLNIFLFIYFAVSCSSFVESTRKSLLGDETPRKSVKKEVKWVSKGQYDDLMVKYKTLNDKYERLKEQGLNNKSGFDQITELSKSKSKSTETVDVFGDNGLSSKLKSTRSSVPSSIEEEVSYYKKAVVLKSNGKNDEALKLFQFLENSTVAQLKVRSKLHIGDIYFSKNQYDLALQVYEDIIRNHAFSSSVLGALKHAVVCSTELGLSDKKAQYESLLKDVFGMQV